VGDPAEEDDVVPIDIPAAWAWSAAEIIQHQWRRVLVIGDVDRGKSTYCGFLSQQLLTAGFRVAVVDADIGQKDIGPPATITLGYPAQDQPLEEVQPAAWYFVGTVSPTRHLLPMVVGTRKLVDAARAPFVVVNTTGFIQGVGRVLKGYKIEAIQPHVVVAIAQGAELQPLLRAYRHYRILRLLPSESAVAKSPEQRREARKRAFCTYLQTAREVVLPYHKLIAQRRVVPTGAASNLLCGLADRRNQGLGLALVNRIDTSGETISLLTPVPAEKIRVLQYGDLYLRADGHELDRR
jgi:polynucleotide 5'-hydroxyl-kinase GRC3/NOL9